MVRVSRTPIGRFGGPPSTSPLAVVRYAFAALISLAWFLAGCSPDVPEIQSGEVLRYDQGRPVERWTLTSDGRNDVRAWLYSHRRGWTPDPRNYAPQLLAELRHLDGTESSINVLPSSVVVVHQYREYSQGFAPSEIDKLRNAMAAGTTANNRSRSP
jgi:hypothetical protein